MSTAMKRIVLFLLLLLGGGKLHAKPEKPTNRTVNYTLCDGDCLNKAESLEIIAANSTEGQDVFVEIKILNINQPTRRSMSRKDKITTLKKAFIYSHNFTSLINFEMET